MKFVCEGTVLSDAAFSVCKACAVKTITPVLECIKIEAKNDGITLTAYDGEISIEKKVKAEVLEEGEICVNGKLFADFVGKISRSEMVIAADEGGMIIRYGDSETNMQTLPAKDFPVIENGAFNEGYFETKQEDLKNLIAKVVFCCATDESRPILKGCLLETKEGKLTATALDGFRMATSYCETKVSDGEMKLVCPARTLTEISRMIEGEESLKIYAHKNRLAVGVNDTVITSRLYAGEFVRKENIFPVDFNTKVTVNKSEIVESVERASVLIRGDKNNLVLFEIKNDKININANSEMGKVEETIAAELEGEELKVAMNGKYLLDALKALDEEKIVLSFNSPVSPFTLENSEDKRSQYLVLPLRTGSSAQ
ncbi:MAG: DNA polymerase III subunit beta [Clostridia bacterium]|nr:DNA polymerase III subunit beta [Clostridia bacterium]